MAIHLIIARAINRAVAVCWHIDAGNRDHRYAVCAGGVCPIVAVGGIACRCISNDIAGYRAIIATRHGVSVIRRARYIVDDSDFDLVGIGRAIGIGDFNIEQFGQEVLAASIAVRGVVSQFITVTDCDCSGISISRCRDRGDRERAIGRCKLLADKGLSTFDLHRSDTIQAIHREGAGLEECRRVGRRTIGQIIFIDDQIRSFEAEAVDRDRVIVAVDGDRQRRG